MISSLLIANRGEIACRIIRTAKAMGIATVAVYSDADAHALHVRQADRAVRIGPPPAAESYLLGERIIAAALESGADAIHPGYGFLSENADFAQAVLDAGLVWVGPKPDSIRAMGLKDAAKQRMQAAGVPVTPGYMGEDQSPLNLAAEADAVGYPVLIKAVAGGGGKGMRRVDDPALFADALASCRREAASSFGDDRVLIEKYILSPRHIEVQVFGDTHGNVVHLFERDCSLQRRHQKVIEEAPAPGMDAATREAICGAAIRAAKAVDYVGAGTIEFIADASEGLSADKIWFMEMNTRLQVEHPVTEAITGVDLVEWQLRVAAGEALPAQDTLAIQGHAIEARVYAENPNAGFLPATGPVEHMVFGTEWDRQHLRVDTGIAEGDAVTPFYDPMIAKLIVHEDTRDEAVASLAAAIRDSEVWPLTTNLAFLHALLVSEFAEGPVDTGFIAREGDALLGPDEPPPQVWRAAAQSVRVWAHAGNGPWTGLSGFRLNAAPDRRIHLFHKGTGRTVDISEAPPHAAAQIRRLGGTLVAFHDGAAWPFSLRAEGGAGGTVSDGAIVAPMPGKVIAVEVTRGQEVAKGEKLLTLEAMKMEHALTAPFDGTVVELNVTPGAQVQVEALLARIERSDEG
ncbi:MAG TPA: acetyl/propionyl/methylcrotonyl-CoA carboxylase subunit alpha [Afifellaceae bacterium]|nr:acetyl/propionyl/methylcrotonyl-CoA carboxylase subunit alpha [Afifellaceae bacterium]